jgi:hypothetical protein
MSRTLTVKNLYDKTFKTWPFTGLFQQVMDYPETSGIWLVYGREKHGKTWFSLVLAKYLSGFAKTLYISAEEGTGRDFINSCKRANIETKNKQLQFLEYIPLAELEEKLNKRQSAMVVFLDNTTVYADELKGGAIARLKRSFPDKLFVFIAHEEKNEPYTAAAKLVKKLAKIIVRVEGLTALISGRCTGGKITIDETKSALYWGEKKT